MNQKESQNLIEIESLYKAIELERCGILSENKRIEILNKKKVQRHLSGEMAQDLSHQKKISISHLEKELSIIEAELGRNITHLDYVKTNQEAEAIEKEMVSLSAKKDGLEENILNEMELLDESDQLVKGAEKFDLGIKETIKELEAEVNIEVTTKLNQIKNLDLRINALKELCSKKVAFAYAEITTKFPHISALGIISAGACSKCYLALDNNTLSKAKLDDNIEFCPGCGRLLCGG